MSNQDFDAPYDVPSEPSDLDIHRGISLHNIHESVARAIDDGLSADEVADAFIDGFFGDLSIMDSTAFYSALCRRLLEFKGFELRGQTEALLVSGMAHAAAFRDLDPDRETYLQYGRKSDTPILTDEKDERPLDF